MGLMLNMGEVKMVFENKFGRCSSVSVLMVFFIEWYISCNGFCCSGFIIVFMNIIKLLM